MGIMNKAAFLTLIFCCQFAFAECPYQSQVKYLWDKMSYERKISSNKGFLPENVKEFLISSAQETKSGERVLLAFYPTECGFDYLSKETHQFVDMQEFFDAVQETGFKIIFCYPQRHFAQFQDEQQIKEYIQNTFRTALSKENPPTHFPSKIILAELQKK